MASPVVESLCCVPITSELTEKFLSTFRTVEYNTVCLATSVLGVCGALWQLHILHWWQQQQLRLSIISSARPRLLRTHAPFIVKWLAVSDLCAAAGIAVRSLLWLWDSALSTGGFEYDPLSSGRLVCIFLASWIHYFYTCTYMWTCLYCFDCVRSVRGETTSATWYHVIAWLVPALLTFVGLLGLYAPDMRCHSDSTDPYVRFLPNYLSTILPLLCVLCLCPVLYCVAARMLHSTVTALTGSYPTWKRKKQCIRHKHVKKRTALPTNRYHLTSPLQQTSLALQETLAKPQNYWQPDHDHWDTLNKTALSQHDNRLGRLKILVGNVQCLLPKMSELQAIASTLSHDIIAINETWLDLNGRYLPAEVSIKGYVLHNVDKPSHSNRGGGSLIYVKEKLQPQIKTNRATEKSEILHLNIQPYPGLTIKIVLV
ncbi:G-protein coupled receptor 143 [Trinorchestia longiramus]|nr:G-protein coupled receptor 143 [Trinorchestia longiramus]